MARVVVGLEEVDISYTRMTRRQAHVVVLMLSEGDTKLKKIYLTGTEKVLSLLEPNQISRAATKLEHVVICDTGITDQQIAAILAAVSSASSKTKTLEEAEK